MFFPCQCMCFIKILQLLLLTVFSSCSEVTDSKLTWVVSPSNMQDGKMQLLVGEWWEIDCRVNGNEKVNSTLWKKMLWQSGSPEQILADGEHIKMKLRNVFNMTKLLLTDQGKYYCKACGIEKYAGGIFVRKGNPFAKPQIMKTPKTEVSRYGSTVTLECFVERSYGDYEIKWFKVSTDGRKMLLLSKATSTWSRNLNERKQRQVFQISTLTKNDIGAYLCQLRRFAVRHNANTIVNVAMEELFPPKFKSFPSKSIFSVAEMGIISFYVNISGTPQPDIFWFRLKNGKKEQISWCPRDSDICQTNLATANISRSKFSIGNLTYSKDNNVSYICQVKNVEGNSSELFNMFVETKPVLTRPKSAIQIHVYNKGMRLYCVLSIIATNTTFSWQLCKPAQSFIECDKRSIWETMVSNDEFDIQTSEGNSRSLITIRNQEKAMVFYRCSARNKFGNDTLTWNVVIHEQHIKQTETNQYPTTDNDPKSVISTNGKDNDNSGEIVFWRYATICVGGLLLVTLFAAYRAQKRKRNDKIEFQTQKLMGTKV